MRPGIAAGKKRGRRKRGFPVSFLKNISGTGNRGG
jgi:hypothetical protein